MEKSYHSSLGIMEYINPSDNMTTTILVQYYYIHLYFIQLSGSGRVREGKPVLMGGRPIEGSRSVQLDAAHIWMG